MMWRLSQTLHPRMVLAPVLAITLVAAPASAGQITLTLSPDTWAEARTIRDAGMGLAAHLPGVAAGAGAVTAGHGQPGPASRPDRISPDPGARRPAASGRGTVHVIQRGRSHEALVTPSAPGQRLVLVQTGQGAVADLAPAPDARRTIVVQHAWPGADQPSPAPAP